MESVINSFKPTETIPEFFKGKNIFVTGFTGYLGKYLVQKLLTSCPDIGTIYVLTRPRKLTLEESLKKTLENPIFDHLQGKGILNKIVPLQGDFNSINLGLSEEAQNIVINKVSVIYHLAATVRFDTPLANAILINVRATRDLCYLALAMKNCEVFCHVSTAYCGLLTNSKVIEEKLYPSPGNWKEFIEMAEKMDRTQIDIISRQIIAGYPNTYTFTKALAEHTVHDLCFSKIPVFIHKPTVVFAAVNGPIKGWIGNMNGPSSILLGQLKGIIRSMLGRMDVALDMIPVDYVINSMIKATWIQKFNGLKYMPIYNCSSSDEYRVLTKHYIAIGRHILEEIAPEPVWNFSPYITPNETVFLISTVVCGLIPCMILDFFLRLKGQKAVMSTIQRMQYNRQMALKFFSKHDWLFLNENSVKLDNYLMEADKEQFTTNLLDIDSFDYLTTATRYACIHIVGDKLDKERNLKKIKRVNMIHNTIKSILTALTLYCLWNILEYMVNKYIDYTITI